MTAQDTPRPPGTEDAWLEAAYEVLTASGVEAVKVMPLARRLGLSRTGFYWHFKDRDALLEAMITRWEDKNTGNLIARTRAEAANICEAMFNLFDCWLDSALFDARLDLAIRNWARNDPALQVRLEQADTRRRDAIIAMYQRFGFARYDAEIRTMTVIYTQIGYFSMRVREPVDVRMGHMPAYAALFTGQIPSAQDIDRFKARHQPGWAAGGS